MPNVPDIFLALLGNNSTGTNHRAAVIVVSLKPSSVTYPEITKSNWVMLVKYQNNKYDQKMEDLLLVLEYMVMVYSLVKNR